MSTHAQGNPHWIAALVARAAPVTGNFVLIGAEAAGSSQGVFMKLMAYVAILVGSRFERSVPFPIRV
ncbi:hypothetical protein [Paraburkholderia elongata]|uniref:hypothetical protein n=1 Tax=Paraburkholderia elongata TaxID=2675747 RepID=UPI001F2BF64B|nr:hypothetical protein [Paraburkholderia elongata]